MTRRPTEKVLAEAEETSREVVNKYLMTEAGTSGDLHFPHAPLVDYHVKKKHKKKEKKEKKHSKERKRRKDGNKSDGASTTSASSGDSSGFDELERERNHPVKLILDRLRSEAPPGKFPRTFPSLNMYGVFEEWTNEQKAGYDKDSIKAIRGRDIDTLRRWWKEGRCVQAANAFGESLLHMACRRGFMDVVTFLVCEAGHNIWIRDDTGRTPLHDACWTADPNSELVQFFLDRDPDMLLVADKRGHTPLDYARKDHLKYWLKYFETQDFKKLLPKRDYFYVNAGAARELHDAEPIVDNLEALVHQFRATHVDSDSEGDDDDHHAARRSSGESLIVHFPAQRRRSSVQ